MTIFTLLLKLASDIRAHNGQALGDIIQLFQLLFGQTPTPPVPNPTPPIAPGALANAHTNMAFDRNAVADEIVAFVDEHEHKAGALGDGTFLKALFALLMKLLPLVIGG